MAAELPRPGVEVIQVFQTVSPTVVTPTLVPCIVGVCRQVVDVLTQTATGANALNAQALVALQAALVAAPGVGSPPVYSALSGLNLDLSLNNGPTVSIVFAGTPLSPAQVVAQVRLAFGAAGVTSFTAEVVGSGWRIRSFAANPYQTIEVLPTSSAVVLTAFGFAAYKVTTGSSYYDQHVTSVLTASFPDPNHNLSELVIDPTKVRAFLFMGSTGSTLAELLQTEAFLENGIGLGAAKAGTVNMTGITYATSATVVGTADVTASGLYGGGGTLNGLTLIINDDAAGSQTLTLVGTTNAASQAALFAAIEAEWPGLTAVLGGAGTTKLVLTDVLVGAASTFTVGAGTANAALGLTAAAYTGTAGTLDGLTLIETFNGAASPLTVTFAPATTLAATLAQINGVIGSVGLADTVPTSNFLRLTSLKIGPTASILTGAGTANAAVGFSTGTAVGIPGVQAISNGNGTALTNILQLTGGNFTASPTAAQVVGTVVIPIGGVTDGETLTIDDGTEPQTLTFVGATTRTLVLSQINALFGAAAGGRTVATMNGGNFLVLTNTGIGATSIMQVVGGTSLTTLGLTAGARVRGTPFVPVPGDILWVDGVQFGTITQVAPGGNTNQLKISTSVPISTNVGSSWYIMAENLGTVQAAWGVTRPHPNLLVDAAGDLTIKPEVIRNTFGNPVYPSLAQLYVQYEALRLDVTPSATSPGLLSFSDTTTLGSQLGPITADNPLALGLYFALLNAPGTLVVGIGVDDYTGDAPFGTVEAFTRAATFLEAYEVYGIAPLTHDNSVAQVFQTHVDTMSAPANKGERIVVVNPSVPTHRLDALVASGTNGNTTTTTNQFDTGVHNLDGLLLARGLPPAGPYLVSAGIYLDIGDGNHYSVSNVVGTVVYLKVSGFLPGENDDGYYATTNLTSPLISEIFAIRIRGASLVLTNGLPDYPNIAATVAATAQGYADRRVWSTFPDKCAATLSGVEQIVDGFYLNAAIVGMIAKQPPQQSFTNFPMTGFTRVIGSNGTFTEGQLNQMAAGGNYIIVQDSPGIPLVSRMALTSDMTSLETRTDSITKVVDFTAKFLRQGLKSYIGRFNITQGFLDSLGHVIQGLLGFLTESGVLIGAHMNNIIQDATELDQVDVDITLDVPFPCNYIRLTLTI